MRTRSARIATVAALGLTLAVVVALPVALHAFFTGEAPVRIGAHTATASPTADGKATLVIGGLLPSLRVDSGMPLGLGVDVRVDGTEAGSLETMVQRDAAIAAAPDGEIARVRSALVGIALSAGLRGLAAGAATVLVGIVVWRLGPLPVGRLAHPAVWVSVGVTAGLVVAAVLYAPRVSSPDTGWTPIGELVPEADLDPTLSRVEVAGSGATTAGVTLIRGAISTYRESAVFYDALTARVATIDDRIRQPAGDEVVALLVSDRHDNVGMDRVARAVGDAGGATILLDAGDDTASGADWEDFSIDSLAVTFDGYEVVAAPGNHDAGGAVAAQMDDAGFTVLDGEPVEVEGITFLGVADPRVSGFGAGAVAGPVPFDEVAASLVAPACGDSDVSTVLLHSPTLGLPVAESGCVDLVLSGHLHRQAGPDLVNSDNGRTTTTFTNGTTGGAAYAFALGSELRRPAQLTLVTFRDGRPRGLQPVDIETDGTITVQRYQPLTVAASQE